jgi:8-oxo-dGTP pyrophosphatase MutT (NUDIX family)
MTVSADKPFAACVAIINSEYKVLSCSRRREPDQLGLVGGKIDPGETPMDAVIRETMEETGVRLDAADLIEIYRGADDSGVVTVGYVRTGTKYVRPIKMEDDINVKWADWEELFDGPFPRYNAKMCYRIMKGWRLK